jgi:hypothetical protein
MRKVALAGLLVFVVADAATAQAPTPQQAGLRGRVAIDVELLATAEWPLDATRLEALKTVGHVRRPRGRRLTPALGAIPDLAVVVEGEDVRGEAPPPKTVVFEGMRFSPGQALLTRPGNIAIENRQGQPLTVVDAKGQVLVTLAPGETKQAALTPGDHVISTKEFAFAKGVLKVLERGLALPINDGEVPFTPVVEGDYQLTFWLGSELLHGPTAFKIARNGLYFIDATISANTVVTVAVKDATVQVAIPVGQQPPRPPPEGE